MIAPETAAAITAHSGTVPREAATPPQMTAILPGKMKPRNAEASSAGKGNTSARTSHPGSDKMRSVTLEIRPAVATAAHPGRKSAAAALGAAHTDAVIHPRSRMNAPARIAGSASTRRHLAQRVQREVHLVR
jgi:hypothetical protein